MIIYELTFRDDILWRAEWFMVLLKRRALIIFKEDVCHTELFKAIKMDMVQKFFLDSLIC